jgi:hypothetical protein
LACGLLTAIALGFRLGLPTLACIALTLTTFSALALRRSLPLLAFTALRTLRSLTLDRSSLRLAATTTWHVLRARKDHAAQNGSGRGTD